MEVRYDAYLEDENENEDDFDIPMRKIELIFSHITEEEKETLEKYNFNYEYTKDNKIKLKEENAIYYTCLLYTSLKKLMENWMKLKIK